MEGLYKGPIYMGSLKSRTLDRIQPIKILLYEECEKFDKSIKNKIINIAFDTDSINLVEFEIADMNAEMLEFNFYIKYDIPDYSIW